ncbi:MAG: TonB-dependent receptor domain-containing protein [Steroidobacteraceae bacterium]
MNMRSNRIPTIGLFIVALLYSRLGAAQSDPDTDADIGAMAEIVVTAHKAAVPALKDRRTFDVTSDLQSTTGTAADILNEIPSVEVDADGSVRLRGERNVTILIDGKPSALLSGASAGDGLLQLPAAEIEKIEVITNPPAQFKADGGAGVINIVMKRTRQPGSSGTAQANLGNDHRYIVAANGSHNDGPLQLSGGVGLRQQDRQRVITDNRSVMDPSTSALTLSQEQVNEHVRRWVPSLKGAVDYGFTDRQSLNFSFSYRERRGDRNFLQFDQSELQNGVPATLSARNALGHEKRIDSEQKLEFVQRLAHPDETLSFAARRSTVRKGENYDYSNTYSLPAAAPNFDTLNLSRNLVTTELSADYVLPFAKVGSLKLGYDLERDNSAIDDSGGALDPATGQTILNPTLSNQFSYLQTINALYGNYEATHGLWSTTAGLRLEQTATTLARRYGGLYPSLRLERRFSEFSTLSISANRRITRPDPEELNPYIDRRDTQNLRAGNPLLLPEDTQSFEVEYSMDAKRVNYGVTGYLRRNRNSVTDIAQPQSSTVVLLTKENLPSDRSEGLEFIASAHAARHWSYGMSANLFYRQLDVAGLASSSMRSTTGLNLKANVEYRPTAWDTAQVSISRSDKRLTPQGYIEAINLVNVGYRRAIGENWSAVLTVTDLLNGQILRRFVSTPTLTDSYRREQIGRVSYIGVVYAFGAPKKTKKTDGGDDDAQ